MEKVLLTGAGGLIGGAVLESLKSYDVFAVYHTNKPDVQCVHYIHQDLKESWDLPKADILIHCAARLPKSFDDKESAAANRLIDDGAIEYCKTHGAKMIYISSMSVYGYTKDPLLIDERQPLNPAGIYSEEKIESEKSITSLDRYSILRIPSPYGTMSKVRTVLNIFMQRAGAGETLTYFGDGTKEQDFISADDVAAAVAKAIPAENGIYNIASGKPVNMKELAALIVDVLCSESKIESKGVDPQEGLKARYDIKKAKEVLGWEPITDLRSGIQSLLG